MAIHKKGNISYFTFNQLDNAGILHGVFMRHGGCSPQPWSSLNLATSVGDSAEDVIENRDRISDALGLERNSFYDVWQVHSTKVVYTGQPRKIGKDHIKADAIITDQKSVALLMLFADCVPILLYDPERSISACAHAGWKGTFNQIAAETVKAMVDNYGCTSGNILACIGPSICREHYQVGEEVVAAADRIFDRSEGVIEKKDSHYYADLQRANQLILERSGVRQVEQSHICTASDTQDWFSHRAENGKTGRFGAVISLKEQ